MATRNMTCIQRKVTHCFAVGIFQLFIAADCRAYYAEIILRQRCNI